MDLLHVAQGTDWWQTLRNTVTDPWVSLHMGSCFDYRDLVQNMLELLKIKKKKKKYKLKKKRVGVQMNVLTS